MRVVSFAVAAWVGCAVCALGGCQDSHASNAERDTHMGDVQAAVGSAAPLTPFGALPPPMPGAVLPTVTPAAALPADAGTVRDASPAHAPRRPVP